MAVDDVGHTQALTVSDSLLNFDYAGGADSVVHGPLLPSLSPALLIPKRNRS